MCRKNVTLGVGLMSLGWGALGGFCIDSWFLCACCSVTLIAVGFILVRKR